MKTLRSCGMVLAAVLTAALTSSVLAQVGPPPDTTLVRPAPDTTVVPDDGVETPALAPPVVGSSPMEGVQAPAARRGDRLEHPITFSARDSLVIIFASDEDPDGDIGTLYGRAQTDYEDAQLTAREIDLLFQRELLRARGDESDTDPSGRPAFERGTESFTGRELAYHLGTQRGRVVGARTALQDGYVQGGVVVQAGPRITYAQDVVYTTCEYEDHNHWGLHTHRMKVIDGEWVYTGAARLHILGIPTPVWLPFGFFPAAEGRRSGPLPPDYGEQSDLGFYVRNVGYYWALSEFFDLQATGGFYTSGSYEAGGSFRYARRYWYDGSLRIGYRFERRGEPQDPNHVTQRQASINWRHNQTLDAAGNTRLGGNIDLRTSGYARNVTADYDQRTNQQTTSNLNLTHRWRGGQNVSLSYRQNLNLTDGSTNLTLPQVSFNQPRWFPFRTGGRAGRSPLDQVSLQYSGTFQNSYRFQPLSDTVGTTWLQGLVDLDAYRQATGETQRFDARATHNVPLSGQFSISRLPVIGAMQLDLGPSLTYREEWFFDRRELRVGDDGFAVRDTLGNLLFDQVTGFTPIRRAEVSMSASTRAFGTFPWRVGSFDGFRHELRPSIGFSYAPDYSGAFWGHVREHTDPDGTEVNYTVRQGVSQPGVPTQMVSFGLQNVFQTRVASEDATGEVQRRLLTLLNLNVSGGYNISADSLNWQNVLVNARSTIADQVSIQVSATYSPYVVDHVGATQNRLYFTETGRPLRFTRANLNASTSLRGGQGGRSPEVVAPSRRPPLFPDIDGSTLDGLQPYDYRRPDLGFVDFAIPWSLSLDFNYGITRNFAGGDDQVFATVNSSFDVGLTPSWRVSGRTGYDLDSGRFVPTQISILRDLHCWEMSFTWLPFGQVRAFSFSIYVKSGHLRDLLRLDVPKVDRTRHF